MPVEHEPSDIEPLNASHSVADFECGEEELDDWLRRYALINQETGRSRTFVLAEGERVIGYYSLAPGEASHAGAPGKVKRGVPPPTIPIILLARLAVDRSQHGNGLGGLLLFDAMRRAAAGADLVGGRALLVHAKGDEAKAFYEHFNFTPSKTDPLHLFLRITDIRSWLDEASRS